MYRLRFAFRIFLKDKFFSLLNILGLALGIAVSMILVMILKNDLNYDQHYANHERIYRLGSHYVIPDVDAFIGVTPRELAPVLRQNYPEIEELVRIDRLNHTLVSTDTRKFYEEEIVQADPTYFRIFSHDFIAGDRNTCLNDPKSVVITRRMAFRYFDTGDCINKLLTIKGEQRQVTAVIEDFPDATHLKFDMIISGLTENRPGWDYEIKNGKPDASVMWSPDVITYLMLPENYDVNTFYSRFQGIYREYFTDFEDYSPAKNSNDPVLQPLAEVHFSKFDNYEEDYNALIVFAAIGGLIVILACINYMNLATAKAMKRATEITMKRLSGASKSHLLAALLGESVLLALISFLVALGIVYMLMEPVNALLNRHLRIDLISVTTSLPIALIIGILSGVYPAFYLTGLPVIESLKGGIRSGGSGLMLRRTLITVQFCMSIFVVVCTLFMSNQLQFIREKSLGFDRNNLLVVPMEDTAVSNQLAFIKNELSKDSRFVGAAASAQVISLGEGVEVMHVEGPNGEEQRAFVTLWVDEDYVDLIGIQLLQGKSFADYNRSEKGGVYLVNEAAVKMMGWGDNAIGKNVSFYGHQNEGKIIGVIKDFNSSSLRIGVDPMIITEGSWHPGYLNIRLTGEDIPGAIEHVRTLFSKIDDQHPFEYFFVDQKYDAQYKADVDRNTLLNVLSYVCVFISLLGLFGLSAFSAVQRTKEIGIRKVLGANLTGILFLLSRDMLTLVIISLTFAIPLGSYVIDNWQEGFAYRAPFNYWLLASIAFSAIIVVVMVTIFQSWRAANSNPVESLKYE